MLFFFFLTLFGRTLSFDAGQYDHKQVMWADKINAEEIYTIHWKINEETINIALEVKTLGWIGFGIAEQTSGTMGGSDVLQGFVKNDGSVEIQDRYVLRQLPGTNTFHAPLTDKCQDWKLISGKETGGKTILEVSRLIDTEDSQDRPILRNGNTKIILAYGADDQDTWDSYHTRERRLATFLDFSGASSSNKIDSLKTRPGIQVFDFFGHFEITTDEDDIKRQEKELGGNTFAYIVDDVTTYFHFYYDLTPILQDGDIHILGVEDIIKEETKDLVHHFILQGWFFNGTDEVIWSNGIYGWAPGIDHMVLDHCGYRASKTTGIDTLMLQTHYDNPHRIEGLTDTSGVRIYYTKETLAHDCGQFVFGQANEIENESPDITPGKTKYVYECLDVGLDENGEDLDWEGNPEITVIVENLHMHAVGREQWAEIKRSGEDTWRKTMDIQFWDFNFQSFQLPLIGEYKVGKGDSLRLTCIYETELGEVTHKFGLASQDEMCLQFTAYYPRVHAFENLCTYSSTTGKVIRTVETNAEYVTEFGNESVSCPKPTIINDNDANGNDANDIKSTILYIVSFSISLYWCM